MKKTATITTLIAAALFAGTAYAANDRQAEDILHGNGSAPDTVAQTYVQSGAAPQETGNFVLWNLYQVEGVNGSQSFVQGESNRDNRDDLRDRV